MELISASKQISIGELIPMSKKMFDELVKAVVDIEQGIMAIDAEMHADEEFFLLEECNSKQENLWGINLYPNFYGTDKWLEFDSMINIRPGQGNKSRSVEDHKIQEKIRSIVDTLVVK